MAPGGSNFVAKGIFLFGIYLALISLFGGAAEASGLGGAKSGPVFDVTKYGVKPKGNAEDNAMAMIRAWNAACAVKGGATVLIPRGEFNVGEVIWSGPCKGKVTVNVEGTLKAPKGSSDFPMAAWFTLTGVDGALIRGTGSFDGLGQAAWRFDDCSVNLDCVLAATTFKLENVKNVAVQGITSINSKSYHFHVLSSRQVTITGVKTLVRGPGPNTDGVHISNSAFVNVLKNYIESGEDCVSVGYGSNNINVDGVTCKGGHGISVGVSAARRLDMARDIRGVVFKGIQLIDTKHGITIRTGHTMQRMQISDLTFTGIQMTNVQNPISIDQMFGGVLSRVKVSTVTFAGIKGTTPSEIVANLACSKLAPCGVTMTDVKLTCPATRKPVVSSLYTNVLGAAFCH